MERLATRRWWTAHERGERTRIVTATNDAAARLNTRIQAGRDQADRRAGRYLYTSSGVSFYVGDPVVTRRNDRRLRTDHGVMVRNRAAWTITAIDHHNLTLTVRGPDGTVVLPTDYIAQHLDLGYAQTIHAAQGRTVDHCLLVADDALDSRGLYVAMTRGRLTNHALVVTDTNRTALDVLAGALARQWDDTPAIQTRDELDGLRHDTDRLIGTRDPYGAAHDRLSRELGLDPARPTGRSIDDELGVEL
jgi:hypothetical protein